VSIYGLRIIFDTYALEATTERLFPESRHRSKRILKKLRIRIGSEYRMQPACGAIAIPSSRIRRSEFNSRQLREVNYEQPLHRREDLSMIVRGSSQEQGCQESYAATSVSRLHQFRPCVPPAVRSRTRHLCAR
jgi:hypothetical protein